MRSLVSWGVYQTCTAYCSTLADVVSNAEGQAHVILRVGGAVGQRRAHVVGLDQANAETPGEI